MTDNDKVLVARLRPNLLKAHKSNYTMYKAADHIEALTAEVERLQALCDHWFSRHEALRDALLDTLAYDDALGDTQ